MQFKLILILALLQSFATNKAIAGTDHSLVRSYYNMVNKAELAIVDRHYQEANRYYVEAFKYKYPNGRDLYNAFVIAYGLKDSVKAKFYLDWLSYKFYNFTGDTASQFNQYLSVNMDSLKMVGRTDQMIAASKFYREILATDQQARNDYADDIARMDYADSVNIQNIAHHIEINGFPSFKNVGFFGSMGSAFNPGVYWLVLWHQRYKKCSLDSITQAAVVNGDFPPVDWATVLAMRKEGVNDPYHMIVSDKEHLTPKQIREIDKKRASVYLESLADYKKKLKRAVYIEREIRKGGGYRFPVLILVNQYLTGYLISTDKISH